MLAGGNIFFKSISSKESVIYGRVQKLGFRKNIYSVSNLWVMGIGTYLEKKINDLIIVKLILLICIRVYMNASSEAVLEECALNR